MSGNPFRRTPTAVRIPEEAIDGSSPPQQAVPVKARKKTPKRVQIVSPSSSPTDCRHRPRRASDGGTGSPPPEHLEPDSDDTSDEDSEATADDDLEEALVNTRKNSGSDPLSPPILPIKVAGLEHNPFEKSERGGSGAPQVSFGISTAQTRPRVGEDESIAPREKPRSAGRPAMDVDTFKNMLMTGTVTPASSSSSVQAGARTQDSGSGTDTSSVSKHSLFEPPHGSVAESPRTSFDDRISEEDQHDDDDEDSSLMGPNRPQEIAPALPPKQSKTKPKGPQTVSFADFDETIPSPVFERSSPETPRAQHNAFFATMTRDRVGSDLNKPLPAPPFEISTANLPREAQPEPSTPDKQQSTRGPPVSSNEASPTPKKPAPPPPVARRQTQPVPPSAPPSRSRPRSTSSLDPDSVAEQDEGHTLRSTDPLVSKGSTPPPPPPSRRAQNAGAVQPSPSVESLPTPTSPEPTGTPIFKAPMPPPPPRRHASTTGKSLTRTPSNSSRQSLPRNDSSSASLPIHANLHAPPAPPPRRGAGSNRNSMDGHRRASNQSFGSQRSGSISSLQNDGASLGSPMEQATKEPPRDILADMTAFQQEIDALRAKAFKND